MKTCGKCKIEKNLSNFYKDKGGAFGYRSICKDCDIAKARKWNKVNSEKHANHERKYRTSNPITMKNNKTKYIKNNSRSLKNSTLKFSYGIDIIKYEEMLIKQNNVCAICKTKGKRAFLCVDHNHKTGQIRALLCANCNSALGLIKEDLKILNSMKNYIEVYNGSEHG